MFVISTVMDYSIITPSLLVVSTINDYSISVGSQYYQGLLHYYSTSVCSLYYILFMSSKIVLCIHKFTIVWLPMRNILLKINFMCCIVYVRH